MKNKFDWNTPFFRLAQSFEKVCIIFFIVSVIFFVIAGAVGGIAVGEIVAVAIYKKRQRILKKIKKKNYFL